ncbi:MAG: ribosome small subunit-dependent GTPase A [Anaerolineae bacterium]|nr:ribosome small subunit-dependent GTPase A [Anaerolineae bacterium]
MKKKEKRKIKEKQQAVHLAEKGRKKVVRHNTAVNQEKHRLDWQPLTPDTDGLVADRRIMPRDEQDRREANVAVVQQAFVADFDDGRWQELADETPFLLGKVMEVSRGLCRAEVQGKVIVCDIRGTLIAEGSGFTNVVAVSDRVLVRPLADDRGLVEEVLPRRSGLARADSFYTHLKQIIAANVDQLLIVASWREPHIWFQLIDEYLIGAARNNLQATICVNKVDLAANLAEVETAVIPYVQLGYSLLYTSAVTGEGLAALRGYLLGKTTVLAGLSGVGKSSLLTAVEPTLDLRTQTISLKRQEGRHTTSQAIMLPFADAGYVVDTPGIRDMGLIGLDPDELITYYPDLADVVGQCRFHNCTHAHEPGCAMKEAVAHGRITDWRHKNYVKLYQKLLEG